MQTHFPVTPICRFFYYTKYLLLNWLLLAYKILNKIKNMFSFYFSFLNSLLSYTHSHYLFFFFPLKFAFYPQIHSLSLWRYAQRKLRKNNLSPNYIYVKFTGKINQTCPFYRWTHTLPFSIGNKKSGKKSKSEPLSQCQYFISNFSASPKKSLAPNVSCTLLRKQYKMHRTRNSRRKDKAM